MKLNVEMIPVFERYLYEQERSRATIEKYIRDLKKLFSYLAEDMEINKDKMIQFKQKLTECYKTSSVNSILAAVNHFLTFAGMGDCRVKQVLSLIHISWGLSAGLAAVAGILIGPIYGVYTTLGAVIGRKGFSSAVIGGYGNKMCIRDRSDTKRGCLLW